MLGQSPATSCPGCRTESPAGATQCPACGRPLGSPFLQSGHVLSSRYVILGPLGFGGMGMVYKAHDRRGGDSVAVKVLRPDTGMATDLTQRFLQEGRLALRVDHPHVCRIYECGEDEGLHFIAMELLDGSDLKHELAERAFSGEEAYDVAVQIAEGLQAIHDVGVVHRDLKTPNIMLSSRHVVKLMDFGLAKEFTAGRGLTATGQVLGTPEYMSPEQVRGELVDARSDLYALGVVVFELFTGDVPFYGDSHLATLLKHVQEAPPLEGPRAARIPAELRPILRALLAKHPSERPASTPQVAEMLRTARALFDPDSIPTLITNPRPNRPVASSLGAAQVSSPGVAAAARPSEARVLVPQLLRALKHADRDIRAGGAQALGQLGIEAAAAVGALADATRDPEPAVRLQAARALGNIGPAAVAARASLSTLRADPDPLVRGAAVRALLQVGPEPPAPVPAPPPASPPVRRVSAELVTPGGALARRAEPVGALRVWSLRVAWPAVPVAALLGAAAVLVTRGEGPPSVSLAAALPPAAVEAAAPPPLQEMDKRLRRLEQVEATQRTALAVLEAEEQALADQRHLLEDERQALAERTEETPEKPELPPPAPVSVPVVRPRPRPRPVAGSLASLTEAAVVPPVGLRTPSPPYPALALRRGVEGPVEVNLMVDERGKVSRTTWVSGPAELREETLRHLKGWKYRPAHKEGVPVRVELPVRITFRIPKG
jgi:TonB family protein